MNDRCFEDDVVEHIICGRTTPDCSDLKPVHEKTIEDGECVSRVDCVCIIRGCERDCREQIRPKECSQLDSGRLRAIGTRFPNDKTPQ